MPFAAIAYKIKPGFEAPIAELLAHPEPAHPDPPGAAPGATAPGTGRLLATGLFVQDDTVVRVAQHTGDLDDAACLLAARPEVAAAERRISRYLADPGDLGTPEGLVILFRRGRMRRVQQRVVRERPGARLAALRYRVRPGCEDAIEAAFSAQRPEARPALRDARGNQTGLLHGVAVFVKGGDMVRVVQFDGELDDVAAYMASRASRPEVERRLAPYLAEERNLTTTEDFLQQFKHNLMREVPARVPTG